jgi:pimeloyl-ACP methyl ester carboxylesterase
VFDRHPHWRRLYLDLPGHGLTAAPEVRSTDDVFRILRGAVEALVPGRYAVVGQSYGGHLARGLVAAHADRIDGLAVTVPVIEPRHADRDVPPRRVLVREPALEARVGAAELDADDLMVMQTEAAWGAVQDWVTPGLELADPEATARIAGDYAGTFPLDAELSRPCLIIAGRQDHITGYRDAWTILERYPRATFAVLDGAGHAVEAEQPVLVRALFDDWLGRIEQVRTTGR